MQMHRSNDSSRRLLMDLETCFGRVPTQLYIGLASQFRISLNFTRKVHLFIGRVNVCLPSVHAKDVRRIWKEVQVRRLHIGEERKTTWQSSYLSNPD